MTKNGSSGTIPNLEMRLFRALSDALRPAGQEVIEEGVRDGDVSWRDYLAERFGRYLRSKDGFPVPFASYHREFWEWVWAIRSGSKPRPYVAVWPRGGAKSTSAEMALCALGGRRVRRYAWYVSGTQDQADDHVQNVGTMLESPGVSVRDPDLAERQVSKYGHSKGWRRSRLRTKAGFTVDAIGLDTAARGVKLDEDRPDIIVLDDIDRDNDSQATVAKKISLLTRKLIPAGAADLAVLAVQNLVHAHSVFNRFIDGRADFLYNRVVSGPHPALKGMTYERRDDRVVITGGEATWAGLPVSLCQLKLDDMGLPSFLAECQHEKAAIEDGIVGDVWREGVHVIDPFGIPRGWYVDRSFDYGYSAPFSVGWWAQADGTTAPNGRTYPRGTLFRIHEWYGWNGKPNVGCRMDAKAIGRKILEIEGRINLKGRVRPGPADSQIWEGTNNNVIATDMASVGCAWTVADKRPGSRVNGAILMRKRLKASSQTPMDAPGLFVFRHCKQFVRTVPTLPRDPADPDDAWSEGEDHVYDEARYRIQTVVGRAKSGRTVGLY